MADHVKIASFNVQGLGDKIQRRDVLNYLRTLKYNIYCLQDTHFTKTDEPFIYSEWGYKCFFNNYNSQSRGLAILINNNFDFTLRSLDSDDSGNFLNLNFTSYERNISLFNIYGPNRDSPMFYKTLKEKLVAIDNECVLVGDFNLILDPEKDTFNYVNVNNPISRDVILNMILDLDLIDCWREDHLEGRRYTWHRKNPIKQARLDFFLISYTLYSDISHSEIEPGYRSDHSLISITINMSNARKGNSYWKFNDSLLKDIEYVNEVKLIINRIKSQYITDDQNQNIEEVLDSEIKFNISNRLFFETLLMEIRGMTISYASFKKKRKVNREKIITDEINQLESDYEQNQDLIIEKQNELFELRKQLMEGKLIRSRAK